MFGKNQMFGVLIFCSFITVGCSKVSNGAKNNEQVEQQSKTNKIMGTYMSNCATEASGSNALYSIHKIVSTESGDFDYSVMGYDTDKNCTLSKLKITTRIVGQLETGAEKLPIPAASFALNFKMDHIYYTVQSSDSVDAYNAEKFCGINNWKVGVAVDIIDRKCGDDNDGFTKGQILYLNFSLQDKILRFGATDNVHDGLTEQSRPVELSTRQLILQ